MAKRKCAPAKRKGKGEVERYSTAVTLFLPQLSIGLCDKSETSSPTVIVFYAP